MQDAANCQLHSTTPHPATPSAAARLWIWRRSEVGRRPCSPMKRRRMPAAASCATSFDSTRSTRPSRKDTSAGGRPQFSLENAYTWRGGGRGSMDGGREAHRSLAGRTCVDAEQAEKSAGKASTRGTLQPASSTSHKHPSNVPCPCQAKAQPRRTHREARDAPCVAAAHNRAERLHAGSVPRGSRPAP